MADYYDVFNFKSGRKVDMKIYMFIVSQLVSSEQSAESQESDDWEGSINYLKKSLQLRLNDVQRKVMEQSSRQWEAQKRFDDERFDKSANEQAKMHNTIGKVQNTLTKTGSEINKFGKTLLELIEQEGKEQKDAKKDEEVGKDEKNSQPDGSQLGDDDGDQMVKDLKAGNRSERA